MIKFSKIKLIFIAFLFFGIFGLAENSLAASNVYHSISPYGTGNLVNGGSPTIVVDASGNATLSGVTWLYDNIGQGVVAQYNGRTSYIDSITSATSFHLIQLDGTDAIEQSSTDLTSVHYEYASLFDAEAGLQQDLTSTDLIMNIACYYDPDDYTADTTAVDINGWTTDATRYINIYTPTGGTQSVHSQRHSGKWNDEKYIFGTNSWSHPLTIENAYTIINGLQILGDNQSNGAQAVRIFGTNCAFSNNIVTLPAGKTNTAGIYVMHTGNGSYIYNNVVYGGFTDAGIQLQWIDAGMHFYVYNNTIYGNTRGVYITDSGNGILLLTNNVCTNNTTADYVLSTYYDAASDYNVSSDSSASVFTHNAINQTSYASYFVDPANGDFHLKDTSANLWGLSGTDLSGTFTADIDGSTRSVPWDIGADQLPKPVYYSVGQNASNHCGAAGDGNSCGNVSIASGVASFTVAQSGNIGVGDRVTFETGVEHICYIASKNSTVSWNLITAAGAVCADHASTDVVSIHHEYTTLAGAIAGASGLLGTSDLVTGNYILNIPCYYDSAADTTAVTINGYTTGENNYIKIYTPKNTTTECNTNQRHQGKWDEGKYRIEITVSGNAQNGILIQDDYVRIDGLQILLTKSGSYEYCNGIATNNIASFNNIYISNNIIRGSLSGTNNSHGIVAYDGDESLKIYNNIVYDFTDSGSAGISTGGVYNNYNYLYNNTVYNCDRGYYPSSASVTIGKNNIAADTISYGFRNLGWMAGSANNASSDASADDDADMANAKVSQTFIFADEANDDFHLSSSDTAARNAGTDLTNDAYLPFATDIDGHARSTTTHSGAWDIGADESATAVYFSAGQNTTSHETGAGTVSVTSGIANFSVAQTSAYMGVGDVIVAGGNSYYITGKTDTSNWTVLTATGTVPADLGATDVTSISHAFASLSLAEAGAENSSHLNTADLWTNNFQLNIPCYYDSGPDTTAVVVDGWTTGAPNYIRIYTPTDTNTEANARQRHWGKWDEGRWNLSYTATNYMPSLYNEDRYVRIDGLQVSITTNGQATYGAIYSNWIESSPFEVQISNNIVRGVVSGGGSFSQGGVYMASASVYKVWNNIVYDFDDNYGIRIPGSSYSSVYNNTVHDCDTGYGGAVTDYFYNNIAQNCTDGYSIGAAISDYNISDLSGDAIGTHSKNSTTVAFVDEVNKDFHLATNDTAAKNAGTNLCADLNLFFNDDIDGDQRVCSDGTWDIGADEMSEAMININRNVNFGRNVNLKGK